MESDSKDFEEFSEALYKAIQDIFILKSRLDFLQGKERDFSSKRIDVLPAVWRSFASVSGVKGCTGRKLKIPFTIIAIGYWRAGDSHSFFSSNSSKSLFICPLSAKPTIFPLCLL